MSDHQSEADVQAPAEVSVGITERPPEPEQRKGTVITIAGVLAILLATTGLTVVITNARRAEPSPLDFAAASSISTMRMVMTSEGEGPSGETFKFVMDMAFDFEGQIGHITSEVEGLPDFGMEVIFTESHMLVKAPGSFGGISTQGKPWRRSPLDAEVLAEIREGIGAFGFSDDPRSFFDGLSSMATEVTEDGQESINGVPTTRYRLTIDAELFIRSIPGTEEEDVAEGVAQLGGDTFPATIWIGEDGLPYRQTFTFSTEEGNGSVVIDYLDYNEPVSIPLPDESQIEDVPDGLFGREASCTFSQTGRSIGDGSEPQPQPSPSMSCSPAAAPSP